MPLIHRLLCRGIYKLDNGVHINSSIIYKCHDPHAISLLVNRFWYNVRNEAIKVVFFDEMLDQRQSYVASFIPRMILKQPA